MSFQTCRNFFLQWNTIGEITLKPEAFMFQKEMQKHQVIITEFNFPKFQKHIIAFF